ncbi:MAG: FKBP-type peptidyl-prolyl cis-trans isomerase [Akkermansiaceae bacterium]
MKLQEAVEIVSQGVGFRLGSQISEDATLDKDIILKAITAVFAGKGEAPNQEKFTEAAQIVQEESTKELRAAGDAFLAENKSKDGIQVTDSGLQYKIVEEGSGETPQPSDKVTVHYTGKLIDGTTFDSSIPRGEPTQFGVTQVIPGWVEGLQLMKPGAKYEFYIPQELAYGAQGSQGAIPPFSALIFEVELIKIN